MRPVILPAIPRMRPKALRGALSAQAPIRTDAAGATRQRQGEGHAEKLPPAGQADESDSPENANGAGGLPAVATEVPTLAGTTPEEESSGHGADDIPVASGADSDAAAPPESEYPSTSGNDAEAAAADGRISHDEEVDLAALSLPELNRGIDVESLFDGDVVRYCAAMWQMGEYIGAARRRGEPFKRSIADAVRRIADEKQLPLDNRLAFSGQVYGRLVYRLDDSHAALTFGTYVHFACLTVRGDKKIVPADPDAERLLNSGLALCENTAFTRDDLNACIFRELTPIVDRRNS